MTIKIISGTLKTEKRKGPKGSYNTNFAQIQIDDDGVIKELSVYYNPHNKVYGLEVYQGENYIVSKGGHDTGRSYSKHYLQFKGIPEKYRSIVYSLYNKVAKRN
jgi:hypothetical protein